MQLTKLCIYSVVFKATGQAICSKCCYSSASCGEGQKNRVSHQPPYFPGSQTAPLNERFLTHLLVIKGWLALFSLRDGWLKLWRSENCITSPEPWTKATKLPKFGSRICRIWICLNVTPNILYTKLRGWLSHGFSTLVECFCVLKMQWRVRNHQPVTELGIHSSIGIPHQYCSTTNRHRQPSWKILKSQ